MLKENSFCTSADSTTWSAIVRWPKLPFVINGKKLTKHIKNLDESKLLEFYAENIDQLVKSIDSILALNSLWQKFVWPVSYVCTNMIIY